jgi:hypothetical protein
VGVLRKSASEFELRAPQPTDEKAYSDFIVKITKCWIRLSQLLSAASGDRFDFRMLEANLQLALPREFVDLLVIALRHYIPGDDWIDELGGQRQENPCLTTELFKMAFHGVYGVAPAMELAGVADKDHAHVLAELMKLQPNDPKFPLKVEYVAEFSELLNHYSVYYMKGAEKKIAGYAWGLGARLACESVSETNKDGFFFNDPKESKKVFRFDSEEVQGRIMLVCIVHWQVIACRWFKWFKFFTTRLNYEDLRFRQFFLLFGIEVPNAIGAWIDATLTDKEKEIMEQTLLDGRRKGGRTDVREKRIFKMLAKFVLRALLDDSLERRTKEKAEKMYPNQPWTSVGDFFLRMAKDENVQAKAVVGGLIGGTIDVREENIPKLIDWLETEEKSDKYLWNQIRRKFAELYPLQPWTSIEDFVRRLAKEKKAKWVIGGLIDVREANIPKMLAKFELHALLDDSLEPRTKAKAKKMYPKLLWTSALDFFLCMAMDEDVQAKSVVGGLIGGTIDVSAVHVPEMLQKYEERKLVDKTLEQRTEEKAKDMYGEWTSALDFFDRMAKDENVQSKSVVGGLIGGKIGGKTDIREENIPKLIHWLETEVKSDKYLWNQIRRKFAELYPLQPWTSIEDFVRRLAKEKKAKWVIGGLIDIREENIPKMLQKYAAYALLDKTLEERTEAKSREMYGEWTSAADFFERMAMDEDVSAKSVVGGLIGGTIDVCEENLHKAITKLESDIAENKVLQHDVEARSFKLFPDFEYRSPAEFVWLVHRTPGLFVTSELANLRLGDPNQRVFSSDLGKRVSEGKTKNGNLPAIRVKVLAVKKGDQKREKKEVSPAIQKSGGHDTGVFRYENQTKSLHVEYESATLVDLVLDERVKRELYKEKGIDLLLLQPGCTWLDKNGYVEGLPELALALKKAIEQVRIEVVGRDRYDAFIAIKPTGKKGKMPKRRCPSCRVVGKKGAKLAKSDIVGHLLMSSCQFGRKK